MGTRYWHTHEKTIENKQNQNMFYKKYNLIAIGWHSLDVQTSWAKKGFHTNPWNV